MPPTAPAATASGGRGRATTSPSTRTSTCSPRPWCGAATARRCASASGTATGRCPASPAGSTGRRASGSSISLSNSAMPRRDRDMDPQRLKDAYQKLQSLDERMTHKVLPARGGALGRPTSEKLKGAIRDPANYTLELKEVVQELFLAIASKPSAPGV